MPATPPRSVIVRRSLPVQESLACTKYPVKKGIGRRVVPYQQITLQPPVVQPNENNSLMAAGSATQQLSLTEAYATAKPSCEQSSMSVAEQPWRQNTLPPVQHRVIPARSVLGCQQHLPSSHFQPKDVVGVTGNAVVICRGMEDELTVVDTILSTCTCRSQVSSVLQID